MQATITRKRLMKVVDEAIAPHDVPLDMRRRLYETAFRMDRALLGGWTSSDCGCLVGTMCFGELGANATGESVEGLVGRNIVDVGLTFDRKLRAAAREQVPYPEDMDNTVLYPEDMDNTVLISG